MNAKVNFQLPEQLARAYSTLDMLNAYTLAFNTTTQLKTLVDRINKEAIFLKEYSQERGIHPFVYFDFENLISTFQYLADDRGDAFDVEREKYQDALNNSDTKFDAGDLYEVYALAHEVSSWLCTLLFQIKNELFEIKKNSPALCDAVFASLERLICLTEYFADNHSNIFDVEAKKYEAEWEALKNE